MLKPIISLVAFTVFVGSGYSQGRPDIANPSNSGNGRGSIQSGGNSDDHRISWSGDSEADWIALSAKADNPSRSDRGVGSSNSRSPAFSSGSPASDFAQTADDAAEFRRRYPNHPRGKEARGLELSALVKSAMYGNDAVMPRAEAVVAEVVADGSLPIDERFGAAAQLEMVRQRSHFGNPADLKRERVASARRLMRDFPNHPGGYMALLSAAESESDSATALNMTRELGRPDVPASVRKNALRLEKRLTLPGREIEPVLGDILGSGTKWIEQNDQFTVLYTWSDTSPGSWLQAKELMILAPEKVNFYGLFTGDDESAIESISAREEMPGTQLTGEARRLRAVADELGVGTSFPIYVINPSGTVAFVATSLVGLPEKIRKLRN